MVCSSTFCDPCVRNAPTTPQFAPAFVGAGCLADVKTFEWEPTSPRARVDQRTNCLKHLLSR